MKFYRDSVLWIFFIPFHFGIDEQQLSVSRDCQFAYFSRGDISAGWKPKVQAVGEMPAKPTQSGQTFTKTSLAAEKVVSYFPTS